MPKLLRGLLAVVAGFLTMSVIVVVMTLVAVKVLELKSGHPTPGYLAANVVYSLAAAAVGGWVAGRIGRPESRGVGVALGVVMVVLGGLSYVQSKGMQPVWYQIFMIFVPGIVAFLAARGVGSSTKDGLL